MQRNLIIALMALVLLLALALAYVLLRGGGGPASVSAPASLSMNAADENVVDPMRQEMDCIDRLMQDNDLTANEVGPSLARCQGGSVGNQSNGQ